MDPRKSSNNIKTMAYPTKSQFLKKITKLVLSLSLFSLLLSSSWFSFLKSSNFNISTFPLRLVTHTIDKNCIFLLCNGILVFLAKNSGFINSRNPRSNKENLKKNNNIVDGDTLQPKLLPLETCKVDILEKDVTGENGLLLDQENVALEETKEVVLVEGDKSDESCCVGMELESSSMESESLKEDDDNDNDDEESDVSMEKCGNGSISTEELNKKFDEFIRKIKEELRFEAQQKLVMV